MIRKILCWLGWHEKFGYEPSYIDSVDAIRYFFQSYCKHCLPLSIVRGGDWSALA